MLSLMFTFIQISTIQWYKQAQIDCQQYWASKHYDFFYHPDCDLRFSDYGIEIPIVDDRAAHVFLLSSIFTHFWNTLIFQKLIPSHVLI